MLQFYKYFSASIVIFVSFPPHNATQQQQQQQQLQQLGCIPVPSEQQVIFHPQLATFTSVYFVNRCTLL
jgi:hypothetical protein